MVRTIEEVTNLIEQKEQNANNAYNREFNRKYSDKVKMAELKGEMDAYKDCVLLIKTSHLLNKNDREAKLEAARNLFKELREEGKDLVQIMEMLHL